MKVNAVKNNKNNTNILFRSKESNNTEKNKKKIVTSLAVLGGVAISGVMIGTYIYKNKYKLALAKDLSKELKKHISLGDLKSVMTNNEFLSEVSKLKEENFISSADNIFNGKFIADLHTHSNYSDGNISVEDLLEQARKYGDKLNEKTGKKFIFSLTDHDGIDGVREAIKIIANEPKKYKNIKFIPGAELSFTIPCQKGSVKNLKFGNDVEMSEILIYGINPYSKTTEKFFKNLYDKREAQIKNVVLDANKTMKNINFSEEEFKKIFRSNVKNKNCLLN